MSVGLAKDSQYLQVITTAVNKLVQSGQWKKTHDHYKEHLAKCEDDNSMPVVEYDMISYIFHALICMILVSIAVAIGEYFWKNEGKKLKRQKKGKRTTFSTEHLSQHM